MSEPTPEPLPRSYGCTYACGNPYDVIIVMVNDATTEFLCIPCFIRTASDMLAAITEPDNATVKAAMQGAPPADIVPMTGPAPKRRGKNAPATTDDDDLISAYESVMTEDELPPEFR